MRRLFSDGGRDAAALARETSQLLADADAARARCEELQQQLQDAQALLAAAQAKAKELPEQIENEDDPWAEIMSLWQAPFKPNLLNTVVFLVETSQMIAVLFVNYKGRPWMKGLLENHPLFLSVFLCIAGVATCAWGLVPKVNELIHLEAFPDDAFRWQVMGLVFLSIGGTFIWDRLITAIFARDVFAAMVESAKTTTLKDVLPVAKSAGMVAGGLFVLANGNILVLGGLGWMYYNRKKKEEAAAL